MVKEAAMVIQVACGLEVHTLYADVISEDLAHPTIARDRVIPGSSPQADVDRNAHSPEIDSYIVEV